VLARNPGTFKVESIASSRLFKGCHGNQVLLGFPESVVSDPSVAVVKNLAYTLQRINLLLMVVRQDFMYLRFQSVCEHFDDRGERMIWTQEMGFHKSMVGFNSRSGLMIKMSNRFHPRISKFFSNWESRRIHVFLKFGAVLRSKF
jgi:hypothetical protein